MTRLSAVEVVFVGRFGTKTFKLYGATWFRHQVSHRVTAVIRFQQSRDLLVVFRAGSGSPGSRVLLSLPLTTF